MWRYIVKTSRFQIFKEKTNFQKKKNLLRYTLHALLIDEHIFRFFSNSFLLCILPYCRRRSHHYVMLNQLFQTDCDYFNRSYLYYFNLSQLRKKIKINMMKRSSWQRFIIYVTYGSFSKAVFTSCLPSFSFNSFQLQVLKFSSFLSFSNT